MAEDQSEDRGLSLGVIIPDLSFDGGAERLALQCVRRWQTRHRITLYSQAFDPNVLDKFEISDDVTQTVISRRLTWASSGEPTERLVDTLVAPRIWAREVDEHDIYLGHQWPTYSLDLAPFVWYAHENHRHSYDLLYERDSDLVGTEMGALFTGQHPVEPDVRNAIFQDAMRQLDTHVPPRRTVANSRFTANQLESSLGLKDVDVVYPGVEADRFLEPDFDEPYFLSVGSLLPHKRHRLSIEALSLVPDARLVIVGRGRAMDLLWRMASILGVTDRIDIVDVVGDDELLELYAGCRAVVFTAVHEPFGMVALEALAAGKPLIAVDEGGFTEVVDASCAVLTPAEPPALARAMQAFLDRPEEAQRMGAAGQKLVRPVSWERTADELEAILLEVHGQARAEARTQPAPPAAPARPTPQVGVRLLLDYGEGAGEGLWRMPGALDDMPKAGFYASHHETTLRRQLAEIEHCGFDFTVLSLWLDDRRLSPYGSAALRHAVDLAPELGGAARFAVELVLRKPPPRLLGSTLDWVAELVAQQPSFEVDDKPLVLVRNPTQFDATYHPELTVLRAPDPGETGRLRSVTAGPDTELAAALRHAAAGPTPDALIVSSWNQYSKNESLEPTVGDAGERAEAARVALAEFVAERGGR